MPAPDLNSVPAFYHDYIRLAEEDDLQATVDNHLSQMCPLLERLPEEGWDYAYAPGKWTLKELVQHIIDAERIFSYRALCIARRDPNPLPGFDENQYAGNSAAKGRSGSALLQELNALGRATQCLFASFNAEQLAAEGIANGAPVSVNAIGYILSGHALHHTRIIRERYLGGSFQS